jgi:23S rRNA (uracil1939-C5)-methyltransferase
VQIGFNAEKSNRIIDMAECHILDPRLFALVAPLRRCSAPCSREGHSRDPPDPC